MNPPVNGTPIWGGDYCFGVVRIDVAGKSAQNAAA